MKHLSIFYQELCKILAENSSLFLKREQDNKLSVGTPSLEEGEKQGIFNSVSFSGDVLLRLKSFF